MTETLLIDYSYSRPSPVAAIKSGYVGAMRYLSLSTGKTLTKTEAASLHKAGLAIGFVWETTSTRATQGEQAGREDHAKAEQEAQALGVPVGVPIFYAVDEGVPPAKILGYFRGCASAAQRHPVGVYGSIAVCEGVHKADYADYFWQTVAWSGGELSPIAHLYQRLAKSAPPIAGGGYDENVVCRPLPMWGPKGLQLVAPPAPVPPKPPHKKTKVRRVGPIHRAALRSLKRWTRKPPFRVVDRDLIVAAAKNLEGKVK